MDILIAFIDEDVVVQHLQKSFSERARKHGFSPMLLSRMHGGVQFVLVAKPSLDLAISDLTNAGSGLESFQGLKEA